MNVEISPYDDCCKLIVIKEAGVEVARGMWCPQSTRVVIDGRVVGSCMTEEEVRCSLRQESRPVWVAG